MEIKMRSILVSASGAMEAQNESVDTKQRVAGSGGSRELEGLLFLHLSPLLT